ncbi:hypothetical protein TRFO_05528 [Tritrichomonas foetus]|uniref:Uncharacterized protein n=1 Tax=Tritrichomonas foetus TaxID=1144522 RepID=A0A1J4K5T4_9EUKA|nr:hypothetical protein TRFO_05528 [Tritrichomonas foetus]|eukprot:OHT06354.1 hypothetical protein TRFO_05528 [Tritrichomonas foetus]
MNHRSPDPPKIKVLKPPKYHNSPQNQNHRKLDDVHLSNLPSPPGNESSLSNLSQRSSSPRTDANRSNNNNINKKPILPPLGNGNPNSNSNGNPNGSPSNYQHKLQPPQTPPQNMLSLPIQKRQRQLLKPIDPNEPYELQTQNSTFQNNNNYQNCQDDNNSFDDMYENEFEPLTYINSKNDRKYSANSFKRESKKFDTIRLSVDLSDIEEMNDHSSSHDFKSTAKKFGSTLKGIPESRSCEALNLTTTSIIDDFFSDSWDYSLSDSEIDALFGYDTPSKNKKNQNNNSNNKSSSHKSKNEQKSKIEKNNKCDNKCENNKNENKNNKESSKEIQNEKNSENEIDKNDLRRTFSRSRRFRWFVPVCNYDNINDLSNDVKTRLDKLLKIARNHFPATKNNTAMLIRLVEQSRACHEFHFLEKRIKFYEDDNRGLQLALGPDTNTNRRIQRLSAIQQRYAKRIIKELSIANKQIQILREEQDRLRKEYPPLSSVRGALFECDDEIHHLKQEHNFALAKEKEVVDNLNKDVADLQAEFEAVEKRIQLMTQKKSNYSKHSPRQPHEKPHDKSPEKESKTKDTKKKEISPTQAKKNQKLRGKPEEVPVIEELYI